MTDGLGILWAQFGPYHFARVAALSRAAAPLRVHALELANGSRDYQWVRGGGAEVVTICPDAVVERLSFWETFRHTRRKLRELGVGVCLLPSYSPAQSLAALLAVKSLGIRAVMMNESHAGTARAAGLAAWFKRRLVGLFDSALVGGSPQRRYFASLGLPEDRIFTGYDAVDNDYFAAEAEKVRADREGYRRKYRLPEHYFLSLGRFVAKKNLDGLIRAYHEFRLAHPLTASHLVMVGAGEEEARLRAICAELHLPTVDHSGAQAAKPPDDAEGPGVHFFGFRQIEENPVFYALADAFILPSHYEEWGLVVNEAMACGLPVLVSEKAGCAEDLLELGLPERLPPGEQARLEQLGLAQKIRRNGFVFDPGSAAELSRVLLVMEGAHGLRRIMGAESRRIVERFSCENFARNALRCVEAALATKSGAR
jgi:glycosyltransferase involved in cell wall biosynthesis